MSRRRENPYTVTEESWEKLTNDVETIKTSVQSMNRIMVVADPETIINDLKDVVGKSALRAKILAMTKDAMSAAELCSQLGLHRPNLRPLVKPLCDKGYLNQFFHERQVYYRRDGKIDLIGFDKHPHFTKLVQEVNDQADG